MEYYKKQIIQYTTVPITLCVSRSIGIEYWCDIGSRVKDLVQEVCKDNGVEIIRGKVASNHVHIYVSVPPYQSISKLVQYLKGKSSRKIQQEFPELKKRY